MELRWRRAHAGLYRGFAPSGIELAQVGRAAGPGGTDRGWMVWLALGQGELPDRYPTAEAAKAAAEAALDTDHPPQ